MIVFASSPTDDEEEEEEDAKDDAALPLLSFIIKLLKTFDRVAAAFALFQL